MKISAALTAMLSKPGVLERIVARLLESTESEVDQMALRAIQEIIDRTEGKARSLSDLESDREILIIRKGPRTPVRSGKDAET